MMARIHKLSPNGGDGVLRPTRIVIHAAAEFIRLDNGRVVPIVEFMEEYGVSSHSFIMPNSDNIRARHDDQIAWHCKADKANYDSLGMEFVVKGTYNLAEFNKRIQEPYLEDGQLEAGLYQVKEWLRLYDINTIDEHRKLDPKRKTDPGDGFPMVEFLHELGM